LPRGIQTNRQHRQSTTVGVRNVEGQRAGSETASGEPSARLPPAWNNWHVGSLSSIVRHRGPSPTDPGAAAPPALGGPTDDSTGKLTATRTVVDIKCYPLGDQSSSSVVGADAERSRYSLQMRSRFLLRGRGIPLGPPGLAKTGGPP